MPLEITTSPEAKTQYYGTDSIHRNAKLATNVLKQKIEAQRVTYMQKMFKNMKDNNTGLTIVEQDEQGAKDTTNVIFRELDSQGRLTGKSGTRLKHGTEVMLAGNGKYLIDKNHVYIKVVYGGKEGYIAAEHLKANITPPSTPEVSPVVPVTPEVSHKTQTMPTKTGEDANTAPDQQNLESILSQLNKTPEEKARLEKCWEFTGYPAGRNSTPITLLNFVATHAENISDIQTNTTPNNATVTLKGNIKVIFTQ